MGDTKTQLRPELRIFCLCGQKMKVTPSMYGRPGKCVACRQKIRIPRLDEVPAGVTELYLRDHPELLRKAPSAPARSGAGPSPQVPHLEGPPEQDLVLGDETDAAQSAPVDPLRVLQVLCSYDQKIAERLQSLKEAAKDTEQAREKTSLMGYRALVRNSRADLDEQLRQRLHEVTDQLSDMRERIARASLALRVGDLQYEQYMDTITPLRVRRDRLERRRLNLTGWLHTTDPCIAGGFVDLPYEDIPVSALEVGFPLESQEAPTLLQTRLNALRDALQEREEARRKLEGLQRMQREDGGDPVQAHRLMRDADARVQRTRVRLEFERGRMEQFIRDCESDTRAIRAHLEEAQARVERGALHAAEYGIVEQLMLQAQGDLNESRALARSAVKAERPAEVPGPKSTFIKRMNKRNHDSVLLENSTGWISAIGLMSTVLLPLAQGQAAGNLSEFRALMVGFLVGVMGFISCALIPQRLYRGLALLVIWVGLAVFSVAMFQVARYSQGSLGGVLRTNPQWFFTPGMFVYAVSMVGMGMSASVTLAKLDRWRAVPLLGALIAVASISLILTNGAGVYVSRPVIDEPMSAVSPKDAGTYQVRFPVSNTGYRSFWLGGSVDRVPDPVRFVLQKKVGEALSWEDYTLRPGALQSATGTANTPGMVPRFPVLEIAPGASREIEYMLEPGIYRLRLVESGLNAPREQTLQFELAAIAPEEAPAPATAAAGNTEPAAPAPASTSAATVSGTSQTATAKLQGVLDSQGQDPQFSVMIETSDGQIINQRIGLGGAIIGQWYASEYSPSSQNLTISDGRKLMVLERGQPVSFEFSNLPEEEAGEAADAAP